MSDDTSRLDIVRVDRGKMERVTDVVSKELPVKMVLNDADVVTLMCSPKDLDYLAVGFLFAEGFIGGKSDIKAIHVDNAEGTVRVETGDCTPPLEGPTTGRLIAASGGKSLTSTAIVEHMRSFSCGSQLKISPDSVLNLMREFLKKSKGFELTGAVHSAALCSAEEVLVIHEDIGRHNAIDKVIGESILENIDTDDGILITSGRVSAEVAIKAARYEAPVVISKSAPTDLAVRLASNAGVTLVGFARGHRMNIYSNAWRISVEASNR